MKSDACVRSGIGRNSFLLRLRPRKSPLHPNAQTQTKEQTMKTSTKELIDDELASSDSDDEHILFQQSVPQKQHVPSKPSPDFKWDDSAISTCFQHSLVSHDDEKVTIGWCPPSLASIDLSALDGWEPAELPLPQWFKNEHDVATTNSAETVSRS